ncbi:MAG: hemagglutinin, partial [Rhodospirillaceae bacterium]
IATTHDLKVEDFNADRYRFKSDTQPAGIVENQGRITVADAGLAAFVAPGVVNHGVITARLGEVTLASGNEFTVDLYGDQKINLALDNKVAKQVLGRDGKPLTALVKNDGQIFADGGRIQITAAAAKGIVDNVVSIGGIVQARSVEESNGDIVLSGEGGAVQVSGTLDASGKAAGRRGGTVSVSGNSVRVKSGARIDVSGAAGGGQALIGGDFRGGKASQAEYDQYALRPARKPVPPAETTTVEAGAVLTADALSSGTGGELIVWSDGATTVKGSLTARGGAGGGDGGFIETSGHLLNVDGITADTKAWRGSSGTWLLDPYNVTITSSGDTISGGGTYTPSANSSTIDVATLNQALTGGSTVVITTGGGSGSQAGDINVISPIVSAGSATLALEADANIYVANSISAHAGSSLNLILDARANGGSYGSVSVFKKTVGGADVAINTRGGYVTIGGGADPSTTAAIGSYSSATYNASPLDSWRGVTVNGSIDAGGGNIVINGAGCPNNLGCQYARGVSIGGAISTSGSGSITITGSGTVDNSGSPGSDGVALGDTRYFNYGGVTDVAGT